MKALKARLGVIGVDPARLIFRESFSGRNERKTTWRWRNAFRAIAGTSEMPWPVSTMARTVFEAVAMEIWESSRAETVTLVASLEGQVKTLEDKRELFEEAFLYKRAIDQNTYQRHREKLAAEIITKQIELSEAQIEKFNIEGAISFARQMLENAATLWKSFSHDQRERFQRVIFPEGMIFADERFGTTATNPVFNHLQTSQVEKDKMATRHGFEP